MKSLRIFAVTLTLLALSGSVWARPGGHHFHSRVSIGVSIPPLYFSYGNRHSYVSAYYPYNYSWRYYPEVVIAPAVTYVTPVTTAFSTGNVVYTDNYPTYPSYTQSYVDDSNIISQMVFTLQSSLALAAGNVCPPRQDKTLGSRYKKGAINN